VLLFAHFKAILKAGFAAEIQFHFSKNFYLWNGRRRSIIAAKPREFIPVIFYAHSHH
jgi:hypothetical protein